MLLWSPPVGDLAAQVFRTELFQQAGLAIWNGSWYGGHYTLTYSVLFPPLAALLGPQVVGGLAVVSSSYLFDRLVRDRWGAEARWATLWFAAGVVTLLADGQLTFALGVAFGLASLRALQIGRGALAVAAAAACALASPVAAAFLAGVVARRLRSSGDSAPAAPPLAVAACAARPRPSSPTSPSPSRASSPSSSPPTRDPALVRRRPVRHPRPAARGAPAAPGHCSATLLAATLIWLVPNAMGGNAVRLGALFGGPVLAAVVLARAAAGRRLVPGAARWSGGLYWQLTASVTQIARSVGDPSTSAAYFEPRGRAGCAPTAASGMRIEVPPTANHWESAYLAPELRARPRLAAPARHHPRRHLLRRRRSRPPPPTAPGCAATRSPTSPSPTPRSTTPRSPSAA